jgi:UDP-N-acetylglucosamine 2-epimerase
MKVVTIIGTRPEIIKTSRVMAALDRFTEHVIVHTGQNYDYELNQLFFETLEIRKPDYFLEAAGSNAAETIGLIIAKSYEALARIKPDAVLILGDTNSSLAALSAKRRRIPIFHMEAGNRCFDDRSPEEINRRIVDHISDINMPYSSISREYLLREGLPQDRIIKTGSPMFEVLNHYLPKIEGSDILGRLDLKPQEYFVVSCHREENVDYPQQLRKFIELLNQLAATYGLRMLVSTHPRTRKRLDQMNISLRPELEFREPLGLFDYVKLEMNAKATLSDSGTISEESSILGFPALNLREIHERPEAMEEAVVMMTGLDPECVLSALKMLEAQPSGERQARRIVPDYNVPNVSEKVVRIIHSYTHYVNRVVWREA